MCVCVGVGVQVLDNSPAKKAGVEAYFDFLVSIDGVRLVSQWWIIERRGRESGRERSFVHTICTYNGH